MPFFAFRLLDSGSSDKVVFTYKDYITHQTPLSLSTLLEYYFPIQCSIIQAKLWNLASRGSFSHAHPKYLKLPQLSHVFVPLGNALNLIKWMTFTTRHDTQSQTFYVTYDLHPFPQDIPPFLRHKEPSIYCIRVGVTFYYRWSGLDRDICE